MALLESWYDFAKTKGNDTRHGQAFWKDYFMQEKEFYRQLLNGTGPVAGTVRELAERYGLDIMHFTGVLDGIDESLKTPNPLDTMDEDTQVCLEYDKELLYKNMVASKANWLYDLSEWDAHLTPERRKELMKEQRASTTVVKHKKVFPNDPCPCGSGRKYKHCCMRNHA